MVKDRPRRQTLSYLDCAALVRECRAFSGLSQSELATRLGTTQSAVSRWERGHDIPRVDTLGRILQACGFEADLVFRRHDDVDRTQIKETVALTPEQRIRRFNSLIHAYEIARAAQPARVNA